MSNPSFPILLGSDLLNLYLDNPSRFDRKRLNQYRHLLTRIRQYRHVSLTVAPAVLDYFLTSLDDFGEDTSQKISKMERDGIIPQGYIRKKVVVDQPEVLYRAEIEYAIANRLFALITSYPNRYKKHSHYGDLPIRTVKWLFYYLMVHSPSLAHASAENHSQADQPTTQTSEEETHQEAPPSRPKNLVARLCMMLLGRQLLLRVDIGRSSRSQPTRQTPGKPLPSEMTKRNSVEFHAPTTGYPANNLILDPRESPIKQAIVNTSSNVNDATLTPLVNQGGQFFGFGLLSQISINYDRADSSLDLIQRSFVPPLSSLVQHYDLSALRDLQPTDSQHRDSSNRASPEVVESDSDRAGFILKPLIFVANVFDNLNATDFNVTLVLRVDLRAETLPPSISSNQTSPIVSLINPSSELANQPSDRPSPVAEISIRPQDPEKPPSGLIPKTAVVTPQILDGSGGTHSFTMTTGNYEIRNFGGVGTSRNPSDDLIREVDTLHFEGSQLTARNLLLDQQGKDLVITFEGVQSTSILIRDFYLENLDNFLTTSNAPILLGNIIFNGEMSIQDSFDVVDANVLISQVFNRNSVTFLNDMDNIVMGLDDSNDVINGQGGNDFLSGLSGDDILRGGAGDDILWGGTGDDRLDGGTGNNWLTGGAGADTFMLCRGGLNQVLDFQVDKDHIGLPEDIQISQVAIDPGAGSDSSGTLIRFKPDGSLLMTITGVAANSLTTDIFVPSTSSLMKE